MIGVGRQSARRQTPLFSAQPPLPFGSMLMPQHVAASIFGADAPRVLTPTGDPCSCAPPAGFRESRAPDGGRFVPSERYPRHPRSGLDAAAAAAGSAAARIRRQIAPQPGAPVIAEPPLEGLNVAEYSVSELAAALRRTLEDVLRLRPGARRDLGVQEARLRPLLFRAQGRRRVSRRGVLAHHRAAPVVQAAGRARGGRDRPRHDLSEPLQVPADRRSPGAGRRRRADGAARGAQEAARGRGLFDAGAQAAPAVPARGDRASSPRRPAR